MQATCNRCKSDLNVIGVPVDGIPASVSLFVCSNKHCKNYGLMQVPSEIMDKGNVNAQKKVQDV